MPDFPSPKKAVERALDDEDGFTTEEALVVLQYHQIEELRLRNELLSRERRPRTHPTDAPRR